MEFDGKKQRNALTAAENAVRALAEGNSTRATANARRAAELDQVGSYGVFAESIARVADGETPPTATSWDQIAATLEPGPLSFLIDELRG